MVNKQDAILDKEVKEKYKVKINKNPGLSDKT